MSDSTLKTVANVILVIGVITAVLAFAAGDVSVLQSIVGAAVVFVPSLFMWAVLMGLAELVRKVGEVGVQERTM